METLGSQVVVALIVLGCFLLLARTPRRRRDEIDVLAERRARETAGRDC